MPEVKITDIPPTRWCISYEVNTEGEDGWVEDCFYTTDLGEALKWRKRTDDESVRNIQVEASRT